jgi:hypothetical protein
VAGRGDFVRVVDPERAKRAQWEQRTEPPDLSTPDHVNRI